MMKFTYEVIESISPISEDKVIKRNDGAFIPFDPANSDYQRYLRWLEDPEAEENGTIS